MRAGAQGEIGSAGERPASDEGWLARLALELDRPADRSVLRRNAHLGPLRVQRPFYPEGDAGPCHVYLLHPPGGVVGSDRLELSVSLRDEAWAVVTTPGAGKFYRTRGPVAHMQQLARVGPGARLELLPQETIVFDGADARLSTRVELAAGARGVGWDIVCLGRPAADERFERGTFRQRLELYVDGKLRFVERGRYEGGSPLLSAPYGLSSQPAFGTFWCAPADAALRDALREACADFADTTAFTLVNGVLVGRCIAAGTHRVRAAFEQAWRCVRLHWDRREPHAPRVWAT